MKGNQNVSHTGRVHHHPHFSLLPMSMPIDPSTGQNCEKNGVICQGYAEKMAWQSGKLKKPRSSGKSPRLPASFEYAPHGHRAERHLASTTSAVMRIKRAPNLFPGLNSELDRFLFDHYCSKLSSKLTVRGLEPRNNPFLELIVPLAGEDPAVMHSLLGLAGAHLSRFQRRLDYSECKDRHCGEAIHLMGEAVTRAVESNADVSDHTIACMILQCQLQYIDGEFDGEHMRHYMGARNYVKFRRENPVGRFAFEFFEYTNMSISMTSLVRAPSHLVTLDESNSDELRFPIQSLVNNFDGIMLKVLGSLFPFISRTTGLRDYVRNRRAIGELPAVDYTAMRTSCELERALMDWQSGQEEGSADGLTAELYRAAALVYLHRTVRTAPRPDAGLSDRLESGITCLTSFWEQKIDRECVLLLPSFIFGCAAFEAHERHAISETFRKLLEGNDFGNVEPSKRIVEEVWKLMDIGDDRCWDWETIRQDMAHGFVHGL